MLIEKKPFLTKNVIILFSFLLVFLIGMAIGDWPGFSARKEIVKEEIIPPVSNGNLFIAQEEAVIRVVEEVSPAVVSIIVTKDLPVIDRRHFDFFWGPDPFLEPFDIQRERREVGGGTGFIISADGLVLTNRHVVDDLEAEYTILTNDGRTFETEILIRDPIHDLAVMRIKGGEEFPTVRIGDSGQIRIGQTVIAIGNSLGEFRNTISVGVVSGLGRSLTATDGRRTELLEDVIQTDAAINMGNSGGPLLNLRGEVIGINTALALGAENIGFSIPINKSRRMVESAITGRALEYPFLGVRYLVINPLIQEQYNLPVSQGAWITGNERESAISPGSGAERAGLREGDIIIEFGGNKIDADNSLAATILRYNPGDDVEIKIIRAGREISSRVTLGGKVW